MALAAGFGLDLERCDPEVFAAVEDELAKERKGARHKRNIEKLRKAFGR